MDVDVFEIEADAEDMVNILAGWLADTIEAKLREALAHAVASGVSTEELAELIDQFVAEASQGWPPYLDS